ncbi:YhzD family protein [Kurthia gibsonii]|uniref:YhzD family protein n=1 Tax=Kurthia gibsonii TaxID=33946 RepID=UPI001166FE6A|nr:hypothetical protein KGI01_04200 [Kurthia gibsonii]
MKFRFTAFQPTGEVILDEDWEFENDHEAKTAGAEKIASLELSEATHRLVNSEGKLILFHS